MGNKNGFDPSIRRGVHQFSNLGIWFTVCYRGSALEQFKFGDRVIFESTVGGAFWLGTVERDCFAMICEQPFETVLDALNYLHAERRVIEQHGDDWFCGQEELPF
ncbi:hypothetical protein [Enterobacter kobei]|uniref:hypothetical protein n=1 Tax=Enterobacter kobei TaxID=208224 RepID=UPI00244D36C1|nr:hypothetical protein [Enterobacter kobei]MDH1372010.1 hypothetical protein [Enterobacter kobei]MDH1990422.1 hypothetical protein [Enterobacter kobei]MDH2008294.1 hypothetical protein [Enterobacter kobei]HCM9229298.1 hypothetical protein [Enterobacter bugandensis]